MMRSPVAAAAVGTVAAGNAFSGPVAALDSSPSTSAQALAKLHAACHEPMDACYLIFGMLLDKDPEIQARQLAATRSDERRRAIQEYRKAFDLVPKDHFIPLIELAVPALKMLSAAQYEVFHSTMLHYIRADGKFSFREWILYQFIVSLAGSQHRPKMKEAASSRRQGRDVVPTLLAAMARLNPDMKKAKAAFAAGLRVMLTPTRPLPGKTEPEVLVLSMDVLHRSPERIRDNFMSAAMTVVAHDNKLTPEEAMFIRLVSLCLERPMPDLPARVAVMTHNEHAYC